ncbi:MAG: abortive infection family protein [Xanthobacteraceae bacterium]
MAMANLKRSEMRFIDEVFGMGSGYVLDFVNRTFAEFFEDEFGINIYQDKYATRGGSKANHLRAFIEAEDGFVVGRVLRRLWLVREETYVQADPARALPEAVRARFFDLVGRIEAGFAPPVLGSLSGAAEVLNFDTVSRDLERALASAQHDPEDAVTAACSTVESVCRSILIEVGESLPDKKDIKALFGAVRKPLGLGADRPDLDPLIVDDVRKILSGLATAVEGIGALRTHGGDAHGRERGYTRLDRRIASLAIHAASTIALFLIETWQRKYPRRDLKLHRTSPEAAARRATA